MAKRTPPFAGRLLAGAIEQSSAYCVAHPDSRFAQWLVGGSPVLWRATGTHADDVRGWRHFDGAPGASVRRPTFTRGVRFQVPDFDMANAQFLLGRKYGGGALPVAAFAVRSAVVVAEIPSYGGPERDRPAEIRDVEAAILGLGGGALDATLGAYHPEANEFIGAANVTASEAMLLRDLAAMFPDTPRL